MMKKATQHAPGSNANAGVLRAGTAQIGKVLCSFCIRTFSLVFQGTLSASELLEGALLVGPVKDGIPQVYWPGWKFLF